MKVKHIIYLIALCFLDTSILSGMNSITYNFVQPTLHNIPDTTVQSISVDNSNIGLRVNSNNVASFDWDEVEDYFDTSDFLEYGRSWIRLQIGLGSNLKLDRQTYKYKMPPVSVQYERAWDYNLTFSAGIGGQLLSLKDAPIDYAYYNFYIGTCYHFNLEPIADLEGLLPYVGIYSSYRLAMISAYEGEFKEYGGTVSLDYCFGVKYNFEKVGLLIEVGSIDTSCFRLGFFFSVS